MKNIVVLGSTGSIGRQTLEVVEQHPGDFNIIALTANRNVDLLVEQAVKFKPKYVVLTSGENFSKLQTSLADYKIEVIQGSQGIKQIVTLPEVDVVVTAMVGFAGLLPTVEAIKAGKNIALANKETLVVAGEIIMRLARENNVEILPVDSEHSAIFQCLIGEDSKAVEKIFLTASGGPFRGMKKTDLKHITKEHALKHPNWKMGNKITIDSATLMNKGLEAIEARWLFNLKPEQIDIVVHPQSIIHSMVQFVDGSIKAQMGLPDMRLPIQFALTYPERFSNDFPRFDFSKINQLTFEQPDLKTFKALDLALQALKQGGNAPCILNAANEIAVEAFLEDKISFLQIPEIIESALNTVEYIQSPALDDYLDCDRKTRGIAEKLVEKTI